MSDTTDNLPHIQTEKELVEDKAHERGIKGSQLVLAVVVLIPVIAVIVFAFSFTLGGTPEVTPVP